jgi:hypothetical protein
MLPRRKALVGYLTWMVLTRLGKRMVRKRAKGVAASVGGASARRKAVVPVVGVVLAGAAAAVAARGRFGRREQ